MQLADGDRNSADGRASEDTLQMTSPMCGTLVMGPLLARLTGMDGHQFLMGLRSTYWPTICGWSSPILPLPHPSDYNLLDLPSVGIVALSLALI